VLRAIRETDLLHADETSWKEGGRLLWLWVFTCASATLFTVGKRTREVLDRVLGESFAQWLMTDGYWAYRDYDWRLRCLAHLMRKARGLQESLDRRAEPFGTQVLAVLETLMQADNPSPRRSARHPVAGPACRPVDGPVPCLHSARRVQP